jgi:outer membrane lipase/esterase
LLAGMSLTVGVLFSGVALALPAYSNVYVFGDSLADSGNNALVFNDCCSGVRTPTPISDPVLIPTYPYAPSNTYSNGPVWTQYFAGSLALSAIPSLAGGTNYAFGGARTGPSPSSFPFSMTDQVNLFLAALGGSPAQSTALYVVEGGGNDARDVLSAALLGGNPSALIAQYAENIGDILTTLSLAGADQFLLWNVPDIGKIPYFLALDQTLPGISSLASILVASMNLALLNELAGLESSVTDGLHFFDAYGAFNAVIGNPSAYGFGNVTDACAATQTCIDNPTGYLFWDGIHPTTAGHQVLARLSLAEIPEPESILLLAIGLLGIFVTRRRAV